MNALCLMPTYGRPTLLANAVACFEQQDYAGKMKLLILDDAGQIAPCEGDNWELLSTPDRYESLPAKYNAMLAAEGFYSGEFPWDVVIPMDDDDIFLPWHVSSIVAALAAGNEYGAKPSRIWSLYQSKVPFQEDARGRFYGSMGIRSTRLEEIGGWPRNTNIDYDQGMIRLCSPLADTLPYSPGGLPSFVYRWQSTGVPHASGFAKGPGDRTWYDHFPLAERGRVERFEPKMDAETRGVCNETQGSFKRTRGHGRFPC